MSNFRIRFIQIENNLFGREMKNWLIQIYITVIKSVSF